MDCVETKGKEKKSLPGLYALEIKLRACTQFITYLSDWIWKHQRRYCPLFLIL
jgi:hypothetical protein